MDGRRLSRARVSLGPASGASSGRRPGDADGADALRPPGELQRADAVVDLQVVHGGLVELAELDAGRPA